MLRALFLIDRFDREQFEEAGRLLAPRDRARARLCDGACAGSPIGTSSWSARAGRRTTAGALEEAGRCAERAITLDPQDAKALTIAGHVRAFLHHRLREALVLHERALMVNPNLAMAWNLSGVTHAYLGDWEEAERRINRYKKLSPHGPARLLLRHRVHHRGADQARLRNQRWSPGRQVSEINPSFSAACKPYLAALGHLGRRPEAELVLRRLLAIEPDFTVRRFVETSPFAQESDTLHYAEGLRLAGVPESVPAPA